MLYRNVWYQIMIKASIILMNDSSCNSFYIWTQPQHIHNLVVIYRNKCRIVFIVSWSLVMVCGEIKMTENNCISFVINNKKSHICFLCMKTMTYTIFLINSFTLKRNRIFDRSCYFEQIIYIFLYIFVD